MEDVLSSLRFFALLMAAILLLGIVFSAIA